MYIKQASQGLQSVETSLAIRSISERNYIIKRAKIISLVAFSLSGHLWVTSSQSMHGVSCSRAVLLGPRPGHPGVYITDRRGFVTFRTTSGVTAVIVCNASHVIHPTVRLFNLLKHEVCPHNLPMYI